MESSWVLVGPSGCGETTAPCMLAGSRRFSQLRMISMTEMSMGEISGNQVWDALRIGIFCNDMSMCDVDGNVVVATRPDRASGDTPGSATACSPRGGRARRQRAPGEPRAGRHGRGRARRPE